MEYSESALRAKLLAGFRGGPMFQNPEPPPKLRFVDGLPPEVKAKSGHMPFKKSTPGKIAA